jgi:hypothetical protein
VAAGTNYQYQRYKYLLPITVGDIKEVVDAAQFYQLSRTTVREVFWRSTITSTDGAPTEWAMFPSDSVPGRWELWLGSSSATARTLRILYRKKASDLRTFLTASGEESVSVAADVATFSGAILTSKHVGNVLRISTDTTEPTSLIGEWEDSDDGLYLNPAEYETTIIAVNSATEAVLAEPLGTITTKGYRLSAHIDVDRGPMRDYLLRLAEEAFMRLTLDGTEGGIRRIQLAGRNAKEAFILARMADSAEFSSPKINLGWNEGISITE